jgi:hypothetical protein
MSNEENLNVIYNNHIGMSRKMIQMEEEKKQLWYNYII